MIRMSRLTGLDALRGVAAVAVFVAHLDARYAHIFGGFAYIAVNLFFMISGYVMARTYEPRFREGWDHKKFLEARFRRLYRPYLIGCLFGAVYLTTLLPPWAVASALLLSVAFLPFPSSRDGLFAINPPGWSLFFELVANAMHVRIISRLGNKALIACILFCAALFLMESHRLGYAPTGNRFGEWPATLAQVLAGYLAGVLIFRRWGDEGAPIRLPTPVTAFIALCCMAAWADNILFGVLSVIVVCPLITASCANRSYGKLPRLLGALSYPLYAVHMPVILVVAAYGGNMILSGSLALVVAICTAAWTEKAFSTLLKPSAPATQRARLFDRW